jgi:ABC-type dipeptide/oligopeptide/nickel transport system permease component
MIALGFAVLNLGIDLLYAAIDPRVRAGMISARARA